MILFVSKGAESLDRDAVRDPSGTVDQHHHREWNGPAVLSLVPGTEFRKYHIHVYQSTISETIIPHTGNLENQSRENKTATGAHFNLRGQEVRAASFSGDHRGSELHTGRREVSDLESLREVGNFKSPKIVKLTLILNFKVHLR